MLGVDIVEVPRIGRLCKNPAFLRRIFTGDEIAYCRDKKNSAQHFAVRFAAKEAVWKALSAAGRGRGVGHRDIGICNRPNGQPEVVLRRPTRGRPKVAISLSHTKQHAIAVALVR